MRGSYYNEIDPFAAETLRNLIKAGHIAPGDVDERSIEDVRPDDLRGYTQCHFFAGVGVWSYALRRAGYPDARPIWTGSCPCQPFSTAGKGAGFADERHLWPHFHWLIEQCRPPIVLGEQVASKDGLAWLDLVSADLEGSGYTSGAVDTCAAGFGAPHIRQRLYWAGHAIGAGLERHTGHGDRAPGRQKPAGSVAASGSAGGLADTELQQRPDGKPGICPVDDAGGRVKSSAAATGLCGDLRPSPTNGYWRDSDWLLCRDGKWRPVEPGTFPLAHGAPARVGRLRAYGNAINAKAAQAFIECVMACQP